MLPYTLVISRQQVTNVAIEGMFPGFEIHGAYPRLCVYPFHHRTLDILKPRSICHFSESLVCDILWILVGLLSYLEKRAEA